MADVKWIKLTTSMFDDEKIRLIESMPEADAILVLWVKLLLQAGKCNEDGYIYLNNSMPYTDEMLSTLFNKPLNIIRLALETFRSFKMIEVSNTGIYINNWHKHQNIEGLDKIREQTRLRVAKHRANQKQLPDTKVKIDTPEFTKEFLEFWATYPRKEGKTAAFKRFKVVKKKYDYDYIMTATKNYAEDCRLNEVETNYIKLPATFLGINNWHEEWHERKPKKHRGNYKGPSNDYKLLTDN